MTDSPEKLNGVVVLGGVNGEKALPSMLVVDDDEFSRESMRRALAMLGVAPLQVADSGRAGLLALERMAPPPDFIICDIFMPDMDGIEFVGELGRRSYRGGLILVTGVNTDMLEVAQDIARLRGLNLLAGLVKPLQPRTLALALGLALGLAPV
jgi:CheY-like chemotaxis protein